MRNLARQERRRPPCRVDSTRPMRHASGMPGRDWKRLADYVTRARVDAGFRARRSFAEHIGVSDKTLQRLELKHEPVSPTVQASIERGLDWPPGSVRAVLEGAEPIEPTSQSASAPVDPAEAAEEFRENLRRDFNELMARVDQFIEQQRRSG